MAVFLLLAVAMLIFDFAFGIGGEMAKSASGILGGPAESQPEEDTSILVALESQPALAVSILDGGFNSAADNPEPLFVFSSGAVSDPGQPFGPPTRGNVLAYKVKSGDTLSGIAAYFGVSLNTIINANPGVRASFIRPGDELNILPVSGVIYNTMGGDTLESISAYFGVSENKIIQFNSSVDFGKLGVGTSLVIPGITSFRLARSSQNSLPNFANQFVRPADGFNWGQLHNHNAIDIANSCGTAIRASAEGLVMPDGSFGDGLDGWNGGYGRFVLIEHPFGDGARTRYAHMATVAVNIGEYVEQGEVIGTMGQTGDASGCHLHFEVYGAANPLAR